MNSFKVVIHCCRISSHLSKHLTRASFSVTTLLSLLTQFRVVMRLFDETPISKFGLVDRARADLRTFNSATSKTLTETSSAGPARARFLGGSLMKLTSLSPHSLRRTRQTPSPSPHTHQIDRLQQTSPSPFAFSFPPIAPHLNPHPTPYHPKTLYLTHNPHKAH